MTKPGDDSRAAAGRLCADTSISLAEIARRCDVPYSVVRKWAKADHWPARARRPANRTKTPTRPLLRQQDLEDGSRDGLKDRLQTLVEWTISQMEKQMKDGAVLDIAERERTTRTINALAICIDKIEDTGTGRDRGGRGNDDESDTTDDAQRLRIALAERIIKLMDELLDGGHPAEPGSADPEAGRETVE
jgi:hypothetical protein